MDEPFGALDAQLRAELQAELLRLWEDSGQTVVFVTHDLEEALLLGDRVVVLGRAGRVDALAFFQPIAQQAAAAGIGTRYISPAAVEPHLVQAERVQCGDRAGAWGRRAGDAGGHGVA
ncbi:hypothetical protein [Nonomuraea sp. GTA35]|uniref:hypothetical protein n=1 Tax=Nonomuraea sp. GTA35 TaxID=1676746 RepID=UPI0035C13018